MKVDNKSYYAGKGYVFESDMYSNDVTETFTIGLDSGQSIPVTKEMFDSVIVGDEVEIIIKKAGA